MEIYCHPVANGTYYFSGACSSTGSLNSRLLVGLFHLSILDAHSLGCDSTSTLQYARCLVASLPRVASATYNIHFILCRPPLDTLLCPPCFPSSSHPAACVLCMFSQRWSLKACNVPLPHSTAFFFNTSIYSSFGQLPKRKKKEKNYHKK